MTKEDYDLRKNTPEEIAGKIERVTLENSSLPSEQRFLPETLLEFRTAVNLLKRATVYTEHIAGLMSGKETEKTFCDSLLCELAEQKCRELEKKPLLRVKVIFGEDAVRRYEQTGRTPSEKWLLDHGGVVDEKCFRTREEYESYMEGINDSEGWYDHHLFKPEIR